MASTRRPPLGADADRRRQPFRFRRAGEPEANQREDRSQLQREPQDQRKLELRTQLVRQPVWRLGVPVPDVFLTGVRRFLTLNFTSTLSPTLLNEARFGMRRTGTNKRDPSTIRERARRHWRFSRINGFPVLPAVGRATDLRLCGTALRRARRNRRAFQEQHQRDHAALHLRGHSQLDADNAHSFKGGAEVRFASSFLRDDVQAMISAPICARSAEKPH